MSSLRRRRSLLKVALAVAQLGWREARPEAARALAAWLDSWNGVGAIVAGMHAQGYDVELRQFTHGWRANFYPTGLAHSIVAGSAWEPTPWRAVQRAAWTALAR